MQSALSNRLTYLEVQNDGPDQAQHHRWSPVHQIGRIDVHQFDFLAGQKLKRRICITEKVRPTQNATPLHGQLFAGQHFEQSQQFGSVP